jgi:hypothetical protein
MNQVNQNIKESSHNIGKIGTALTLLCSIHCMLTPFLAVFVPFFHPQGVDWLEVAIISGVLILGSSTMWHSYKGHHQNFKPFGIFAMGIVLMLAGMLIHSQSVKTIHQFLMIGGSLLSAGAQFWNLKLAYQSERQFIS